MGLWQHRLLYGRCVGLPWKGKSDPYGPQGNVLCSCLDIVRTLGMTRRDSSTDSMCCYRNGDSVQPQCL
ncbi:hypothetical protein BJX66DRAFT_303470 [Aspergillus keveii]|uniref:Uncharacterized protein n=1 Tax=Aspergillus keveii TaxID=714993 RepID=A0ABR4G7F2_9EURO